MSPSIVHVACLCAAWCRLCDDYAPLFDTVTAELATAQADVVRHWIDIEDEAELLGDFDVETFPTLVVVGPDAVRFAGPLTPQIDVLRGVLRSTVGAAAGAQRWPAVAAEVEAFASRLRLRNAPG